MNINTGILRQCERVIDQLHLQMQMLTFNVKYKRVSHTVALLRRIYENASSLQYHTQDADDFSRLFSKALHACQIGPTEYVPDPKNNSIFIHGNFDLNAIRSVLIVCDVPTTLSVQKKERQSE